MDQTGQIPGIREIREKEIRPLLREIVRVIRQYTPEESYRILLFGSWVTLESLPTADIDVAILGPSPVNDLAMATIRERN